MRQALLITAFLFTGWVPVVAAELKLTGPFADEMVLQREKPIRIWGTASEPVSVDLGDQHATATPAKDGKWQVELKPLPASGPFEIHVTTGDQKATLHDVMIGDVWLCAGQSNMQLTTSEDLHAEELLHDAEKLANIHVMVIPKSPADHPRDQVKVKWQHASKKSVEKFSNVGFQFGRFLSQDSALKDVPIGLIDDSFGGTAIEGWTPQSALAAAGFKPDDLMTSMFGIKPTNLYNGMIAPLGPTAFRGVLWYQGENNAPRAGLYPKLFAAMAAAWREQFQDASLPIFLVQLPPFDALYAGYPFTWMREAQQKVVDTVPNTGLAISIDTCDGFDLHPRDKGQIARRLSLLARHDVYHEPIVYQGPKFVSAAVEGSAIRVKFDPRGSGLTTRVPDDVKGFQIAGVDGIYRFAAAIIDGMDVVVRDSETAEPKTVRYAWGANPNANLVNTEGLPAGPFRTDDAPITLPIELRAVPQQRRMTTPAYDLVVNGDGSVSSLVVGGKQFLANSNGGVGAAHFAGGFGPRQLMHVKPIGENEIQFGDAQLSITFGFTTDTTTWTIHNQGGATMFQIDLDSSAKAAVPANGSTTVEVGPSRVDVAGIDSVKHGFVTTLEAKVADKATRVVTLRAVGKNR